MILNERIRELVVEGLRRNADRIFDLSQRKVPVNTGNLRNSGFRNDIIDGAEIGYRAPYAIFIHSGRKGGPITGKQVVHIKAYNRKSLMGRIPVKAHDRIYENKRLIPIKVTTGAGGMRTIFRVISHYNEKKPNPFLWDAAKEGLHSLVEDIAFSLGKLGEAKWRQ